MLYQIYKSLIKLSDGLFVIEKILLFLAVFTVVAVNFANVCLRYVASYSLNYCETLSVVLFMFMVLIGANISVKSDSEIKIEFFKFKSISKDGLFHLIGDVIAIVAIVICLFGLFDTVAAVLKHKQKLTPLPLYTYHIYIVMTCGFLLVLLDRLIISLKHLLQALNIQIKDEVKAS